MTSGKPLTDNEKEYIRLHKDDMFKRQIAMKLSELYPEDNGGYRSQTQVRKFIQQEEEKDNDH